MITLFDVTGTLKPINIKTSCGLFVFLVIYPSYSTSVVKGAQKSHLSKSKDIVVKYHLAKSDSHTYS